MRYYRSAVGGFSLVEAMFAVGVVVTFFVGLYTINSQCLYFVNASREVVTAGQIGQSRLEQILDCTWTQVTDSNYIRNSVLITSMAGAQNLGQVTEVLTINKYPTAVNPPIKVTRASNGTVTIDTTNSAIASGDLATVSLQLTWAAGRAGRARTITVATLYAKNSK